MSVNGALGTLPSTRTLNRLGLCALACVDDYNRDCRRKVDDDEFNPVPLSQSLTLHLHLVLLIRRGLFA
ncbi:MAG: hypothetical protein QOJ70_3626 [Acidobacteriota bacterium]|jgi:hypothetical protein|nr:hypothetical protein [Acidobacteriota bacterium]